MDMIKFTHLAAVLEEYAIAVRNKYQDRLILHDKVASGELLNSIEFVTHFQGMDYWVGLRLEDYWKYVEYGTDPHSAPYSKIYEWVRVKPVLPRPKNCKLPTPEQVAWAVWGKIKYHGTEETPDLRDTTKEMNALFEQRITEAIDADMGDAIDGVIRVLFTQ